MKYYSDMKKSLFIFFLFPFFTHAEIRVASPDVCEKFYIFKVNGSDKNAEVFNPSRNLPKEMIEDVNLIPTATQTIDK